MTKQPHKRLSQKESYEALRLVGDNGKMDGDYFVYSDGWNDHRIAAAVGVNVAPVQARRREVFGELRPAMNGTNQLKMVDLDARLTRVEEALTALLDENTKGEVLMSDSARQRMLALFEVVK